MKAFQRDFIEFAIARGVLKFGEFTLKSGRISPYFFNAGLFNSGGVLAKLGRFYADALVDAGVEFDVLFGPAYKGIPIATTTAVALADSHQRDVPYCFNRKEAKTHGEGGNLVGSPLEGRVMLVDDVISSGHTMQRALLALKAQGFEGSDCLCIHGLFADGCDVMLKDAGAARLISCNSILHPSNRVDLGPVIAEAVSSLLTP